MSHIRCPGCGVTIVDRDGHQAGRPCPRCLVRRNLVVLMEARPLRRSYGGDYQVRGH
jgi:hypothetical protein